MAEQGWGQYPTYQLLSAKLCRVYRPNQNQLLAISTATRDRLRGHLAAPIIQTGLPLGSLHGNRNRYQKACPRSSKPFHSCYRFRAGRMNDVLHEYAAYKKDTQRLIHFARQFDVRVR